MRGRLGTAAEVVMLLVFALSALVQANDPDPLPWIGIYGASAVVGALALRRPDQWLPPALVGAVALVWAATIAPRVVGRVPFGDMFGAWEMANPGIEASREMYGLLIVASWMAFLTVRGLRRARGSVHAT